MDVRGLLLYIFAFNFLVVSYGLDKKLWSSDSYMCWNPRRGIKGMKGDVGISGLMGYKGEKGDIGSPGSQGPEGPPGLKGDMGIKGRPGLPGSDGPKGIIGNPGPRGRNGAPGGRGDRGTQGLRGHTGLPGEYGPSGDRGDVGLPGEKGETGLPGKDGVPGTNPCVNFPASNDIVPTTSLGTAEYPFNFACKSADVASGKYKMFKSNPFDVYCNKTNQLTCVGNNVESVERTSPIYEHNDLNEPLWLSEIGNVEIPEWYGLTRDQLSWLQAQSTFAKQTLRIYYKNFEFRSGPEKSISLLTWNYLTVKSYCTPKTPFLFNVKSTSETSESNWCYVDIELVSKSPKRLPIVNVLIEDVKGESIQVKIANKELCYG